MSADDDDDVALYTLRDNCTVTPFKSISSMEIKQVKRNANCIIKLSN